MYTFTTLTRNLDFVAAFIKMKQQLDIIEEPIIITQRGRAAAVIIGVEAYEKAVQQSPSYVDNIKVMILRSERYDIEKSAERIFLHFDIKLTLFGK